MLQPLNALRWANLALRFFLELCVFAAMAFWGYHVGANPAAKIALAIGLFLLVIVVWGVFLSPRARVPLPTAPWVLLQVVIFGAAVAGLAVAGRPRLALILAALLVVNSLLLFFWHGGLWRVWRVYRLHHTESSMIALVTPCLGIAHR